MDHSHISNVNNNPINMKRIKLLDPIWFVKSSLSFMKGYPLWYIWSRMPRAYFHYCKSVILNK